MQHSVVGLYLFISKSVVRTNKGKLPCDNNYYIYFIFIKDRKLKYNEILSYKNRVIKSQCV